MLAMFLSKRARPKHDFFGQNLKILETARIEF